MIKIRHNIPQVQRRLSLKSAMVRRSITNSLRKVGFLVERYAKQRAPVDTGRLRASIASSVRDLTATIMTNVDYAIYVHDGTRYMRANPFMTSAYKDAKEEIRAVFQREIRGVLR